MRLVALETPLEASELRLEALETPLEASELRLESLGTLLEAQGSLLASRPTTPVTFNRRALLPHRHRPPRLLPPRPPRHPRRSHQFVAI
jgi:hypothetical protein